MSSNLLLLGVGGGEGGGDPPSTDILLIIAGESNAGGQAVNAQLSTWELAARDLQIWNNTSSVFQALDIGTNNLISHAGLTNNATHGAESSLATAYAIGEFDSRNVKLIKSGQGGSKIELWTPPSDTYYTTLKSRIESANTAIGSTPNCCLIWFHGINDIVAGTDVNTWESETLALFDAIIGFVPNLKVLFVEIMGAGGSRDTYNAKIDSMVAAHPSYMYKVPDLDYPLDDSNHWSSLGFQYLGRKIVNVLKTVYGLAGKSIAWTTITGSVATDSGDVVYSGLGKARSTSTVDLSTVNVLCEVRTHATVIGFASGSTNSVTYQNMLAGVYRFNDLLYACGTSASPTDAESLGALTHPGFGRFRKSGNDLVFEYSTDERATWTTRKTFAGVLSGGNVFYIWTQQAVATGRFLIWTEAV